MSFKLNLETETITHARPAVPLTVEPHVPVSEVLGLMKEKRTGSVLVCRDGMLRGIFTENDAVRLMAFGADLTVPVEKVMSSNPVTVLQNETVGSGIKKMSEGGYRRLPVVDDSGRPVGLLKVSEILHYLVEHFPKYVYNLPPSPHHATQQREGA